MQERFAALLGRLAEEADVHVLLSMRDDFLMRCDEHEALAPVFDSLTPLRPLTGPALRRALEEPATAEGFSLRGRASSSKMTESVEGERGALPLLAFAVSQLWERRDRDGKRLTLEAYAEIGGVAGALARHAEATLERIGAERQGMVREVFRNLVTSQGTRAACEREELLSVLPDRKAAEEVLGELIDARLLTSYELPAPDGGGRARRRPAASPDRDRPRVAAEVVAPPRAVAGPGRRRGAAAGPAPAGRAPVGGEGPPGGSALDAAPPEREYEVWRERYPGKLTAVEEDFARAMTDRARRLRRIRRAVVTAVILALAGFSAVIAVSRHREQAARARAEAEALRAEASRVLALAELRLDGDPTEALAYATASLELADTEEARVFVMRALQEAPPAFQLDADGDARVPVFSADGTRLAAGGQATEYARVWDDSGGEPILLPGHEITPQCAHLAQWGPGGILVTANCLLLTGDLRIWSPGGDLLRTLDLEPYTSWTVGPTDLFTETKEAGPDGTGDVVRLRSWRLPHGPARELGRVDRGRLGATHSLLDPRGAGWYYTRGPEVWFRPPLASGARDRLLARLSAEVVQLEPMLGDPTRVVAVDDTGEIVVWRTSERGPELQERVSRPQTAPALIAPESSGRWIVGPPWEDNFVRLWETGSLPGARPLRLRRSGSWYAATIGLHPSGEWLAASTDNWNLTLWPLPRARPHVVDGYPGLRRPVVFSPDGRWVGTVLQREQQFRLLPVPGGESGPPVDIPVPEPNLWCNLAFDPGQRFLFAVGNSDRAYLVPLDGGPPRQLDHFSDATLLDAVGVSPSGLFVATAFLFGEGEETLRVWNARTGDVRVFDLPAKKDPLPGARHTAGIFHLRFRDDSTLHTLGRQGVLRWDLETGDHEVVSEVGDLDLWPGGAFCGDGRTALAVKAWTERCAPIVLVDLATGASRDVPQLGACAQSLACDRPGEVAVSGDLDGVVRVARLDGSPPHLLVGHEASVTNVAISPDRKWVASSGEDGTVRLWPMPDLDKPPLHTLPRDELIARLHTLTNLRAVREASGPGWTIEIGPFPGWREVPEW